DREGADGGGAVAAVARVVDLGLAHLDLGEGVVDVGARHGRGADDHRLGQRRDAATETVELTAAGIGGAERGEEDRIAVAPGRRQVAFVEDETAAGAAAHVDGGDPALSHRDPPAAVWASKPPASRRSRSRGVSRQRAWKVRPERSLT